MNNKSRIIFSILLGALIVSVVLTLLKHYWSFWDVPAADLSLSNFAQNFLVGIVAMIVATLWLRKKQAKKI